MYCSLFLPVVTCVCIVFITGGKRSGKKEYTSGESEGEEEPLHKHTECKSYRKYFDFDFIILFRLKWRIHLSK